MRILIEIKSTDKLYAQDFKYLNELSKEFNTKQVYVFSNDKSAQMIDDVRCVYWEDGVKELFL
ncbi:MAG: hypothetical protein ACXVCY_02255 [Pseudobdellovibrionaceae bacterium]